MSSFLEVLNTGRVLLMDGAMGTELQRAGLPDGECHELWNLKHPEKVRAIHQAYVDAGAECLLTNTFQANRPALARHGEDARIAELQESACSLARAAAGPGRYVLADVGASFDAGTGEEFPESSLDWAAGRDRHVDALLVETCSSPRAFQAIQRDRLALPVLLSLTYQRGPGGELTSFSGHTPEWFARRAREHGVVALGVNCGRDIGMDEIIEILRRYRQETDLPLFARPNAGTPTRNGDGWEYPRNPEEMAARLPELLEAGVSIVGGCCGTTPAHLAAFRPLVDAWNAAKR
jgi:5-methyltetrahydrofolate--homocysteine methyltransferase